jgi:hypothetical protein
MSIYSLQAFENDYFEEKEKQAFHISYPNNFKVASFHRLP